MARFLSIPLHEADFVAQYWTRVFANFVELSSRGLTPNPDLGAYLHPHMNASKNAIVTLSTLCRARSGSSLHSVVGPPCCVLR